MQDISQAGSQVGIRGDRSSLVKEMFHTFDGLKRGPAAENYFFSSGTA